MSHGAADSSVLRALAYARARRGCFVQELQRLVRFPTISAHPKHANDLRSCAAWLAEHLRQIGLHCVEVVPTPRHPLVCGEWRRNRDRPTVLIYGHYDVQPVDPLREWHFPPFAATVKNGVLLGRGASDDKGQLFAHVKAFETYLRTAGSLPLNVKCLFEGEEEIGSPHMTPFLREHREAMAADVAVVSDTRILGPDRPAITYALRGALGLEWEVAGPAQDLHSGMFGGAVYNPIQALCEMIDRLHERAGRVAIPGFYDSVRQWGPDERAYMAEVGPDDEQIAADARVTHGWGEAGYSAYERTTIRPALTINGIQGGYEGPGAKAVIPARALAKLSFRLVPDQDPREVNRLFRDLVARLTPPTVRSTVRTTLSAHPVVVRRNHPAVQAAAAAYRQGFGARPVFLRSGGTIPVVNAFREILEISTVLMGFALPDDGIHAPNEKFDLPIFFRAVETCIWFLMEAAARLLRRVPLVASS